MKKAVSVFLCSLISTNARADWVSLTSNYVVTEYADSATVRKADKKVKMVNMSDFRFAQKANGVNRYYSAKILGEYDCREVRYRQLRIVYFSKDMGKGDILFIDSKQREWTPIAPKDPVRVLWNYACGTT